MDEVYRQVLGWFQARASIRTDDGELSSITLSHNGQTRKLEIARFNGEDFGHGWDPEDLCARAMQAAEADVNGIGGNQRYILEAYHGKRKRPSSIQRFRLYGRDDDDYETEPANEKGLMSQLMRHNEVTARTSAQGQEVIIRYLTKALEKAHKRIDDLESRSVEMMDTYEQLIMRKHERELETLQVSASEARKDEAFESFKLLMPAVANRIMGKKVLPESTSPEGLAIKALVESLDNEQLEKLGEVLKPAQMMSVMEMARKYLPSDTESKS